MSEADFLFFADVCGEEDTGKWAAKLASELKRGDCVTLSGDLGAGKTAFARALIRSLSYPDADVASPTFTLVQTYPIRLSSGEEATCWHSDLYRIQHPAELVELGLEEGLEQGILLVEWPEVAAEWLPHSRLEVRIAVAPQHEHNRRIEFWGDATWRLRLMPMQRLLRCHSEGAPLPKKLPLYDGDPSLIAQDDS